MPSINSPASQNPRSDSGTNLSVRFGTDSLMTPESPCRCARRCAPRSDPRFSAAASRSSRSPAPVLGCQMPDDRRSKIGLLVSKATIPPPVHALHSEPELASVRQTRQPRQIFGFESPALSNLLRRPQPLHRSAPVVSRQTTDLPSVRSSQLGQFAQLRGHWAEISLLTSNQNE